MKLWRELSIGERIALTFVIVLTLLLALALFGYLTGGWDEEGGELKLSESWSKRHKWGLTGAAAQEQAIQLKPHETCMNEESRERIRGIMLDAIDDALHNHIERLFETWMKDERGQPSRAGVGARQGIRAHQLARKVVIAWEPPECPQEQTK